MSESKYHLHPLGVWYERAVPLSALPLTQQGYWSFCRAWEISFILSLIHTILAGELEHPHVGDRRSAAHFVLPTLLWQGTWIHTVCSSLWLRGRGYKDQLHALPTETGEFTCLVHADFPLMFAWSVVGIAEKVSVGKLPFPQSFGQEERLFLEIFFSLTADGTGLGASEAAPCQGNVGGTKKMQGPHCFFIPQVLMSLGSMVPFFSLPFGYLLCLFVVVYPGFFFNFQREDLGGMKLLHLEETASFPFTFIVIKFEL